VKPVLIRLKIEDELTHVQYDPNIKAKLVYDGKTFTVPEELGKPTPEQLMGSVPEQVSELCGRICYDSLGKGRGSTDYHKHLLQVGHFSVYEHVHFTAVIEPEDSNYGMTLLVLANRPGLTIAIPKEDHRKLRITFNPRHLLDWEFWDANSFIHDDMKWTNHELRKSLVDNCNPIIPSILQSYPSLDKWVASGAELVEPLYPSEKWVTMYLSGSRGMSHEQVRHRFCISQRSTRYVDESESAYITHPLITNYAIDTKELDPFGVHQAKWQCAGIYDNITASLSEWLRGKGIDKFTARKQARGAARGYLGNALATELMFSAPINMWKHMLRLRCSIHADAEIRVMYASVLEELRKSQYAEYFSDLELVPSGDGIGQVLK